MSKSLNRQRTLRKTGGKKVRRKVDENPKELFADKYVEFSYCNPSIINENFIAFCDR
jgi:hypothetical protein